LGNGLVLIEELNMNDVLIYGLVAVAVLAVLGLGIKVAINFQGGSKVVIRDIDTQGDVVGGNKITNEAVPTKKKK
jgi:hypothetical protein